MNKSTFGASSILDNLRKKIGAETQSSADVPVSNLLSNVNMCSYIPPKDGVAVASFKIATTEPNVNTISTGISKLFKNELRVVPGTLKVLEKSKFFTSVSAHLVRNTITRAISNNTIPKGFISLSKNIFMEERDSKTWKLVTTDEGKKILVRDHTVETDSDMEKLLSSLSSVNHKYTPEAKKMVSQASSLLNSLNVGVLVSYITESGDQEIGFVVQPMDNEGNVGIANDRYQAVANSRIFHAFDLDEYYDSLRLPSADSISGKVDVNVMLEYYKKVYGYNKKFMDKLLDRVRTNSIL